MKPYVTQTTVHDGHISLDDIPIDNETEVEVMVVQKTDVRRLSFKQVRELTKDAKGSLADEISREREAR